MAGLRSSRTRPLVPFAVDSVLLAGLLVATFGHSGGQSASGLIPGSVPHSAENDSEVDLAINPPSYWMRTGTNVTLEAVWSSGPPGCDLTPLWYGWAEVSGNATGYLNASTGPSTTFFAASFDSGSARVVARAAAVLECGANETVIDRTSEVNLTLVAPLSLSGVGLSPNVLLPGQTATLEGGINGGEAPYTLEVAWGDGTRSRIVLSIPGGFSVAHTFAAGEFVPAVSLEDAEGDLANTPVDEAVSVGSGLEVGILPARAVAEVGMTVEFTGVAVGASPAVSPLFDCSNASVGPATTTPNGTVFPCTFTSPGTAVVLFGEYPTRPGGPSASTILYEAVVDPPTLSVTSVDSPDEAGVGEPLRVNVSGGVLPITLTWNRSGGGPGGEETLGSNGEGVIMLASATPGDYLVEIGGNDSAGGTAPTATTTLRVGSSLASNAAGASRILSYGALAEVSADAVAGCAPFAWWVVPSLLPSNDSAEVGGLATVGDFGWNGSYALEGNLTVTVGVADSCGATSQTELRIELVPSLTADATVAPGPTSPIETLAVNLSVHGGLPPYRLYVNASNGESWNRTVSSQGASRWWFPTDGTGSLGIAVSISDLLGANQRVDASVVLVPPSGPAIPSPPGNTSPPGPSPDPSTNSTAPSATVSSWLAAMIVLASVGTAIAIFLLRRRKAQRDLPPTSGPDPVATLRRIIEPADGAERFTVELLAEEVGIPLTDVRSTIDRLVRDGRIRSESGADGEEVLSWSPEASR